MSLMELLTLPPLTAPPTGSPTATSVVDGVVRLALPPPAPGTRFAEPPATLLAPTSHLLTFAGRGPSLVIGPVTLSVSPRAVAIDDVRGLALECERAEWRVRIVATRGKPMLARVPAADGPALALALRERIVPGLVAALVAQMQLGETIEVGDLQLSHRYLRAGRREAGWGQVEIVDERGHLVVRDISRDRRPVLAKVALDAMNAFILRELVAAGAVAFPSPW